MKIGLAQINPTVGDLQGNVMRCCNAIEVLARQGADLIIMPEMVIPGCPARDILFDPSFIDAVHDAASDLAWRVKGFPPALLGSIVTSGHKTPFHPGLFSAALSIHNGDAIPVAYKRILRSDDVFNEPRWFLPGDAMPPVKIGGVRIGFLLGHDLEEEGSPIHPASDLIGSGAELLVCLSASPYTFRGMATRLSNASRLKRPVIYVNLCGANDELIFDGRSFVLDKNSNPVMLLKNCSEDIQVIDLEDTSPLEYVEGPDEALFQALTSGIRDFVIKNRMEKVYLGLSGGIDSAVVAVLAREALGGQHVTALALPSRHTDPRSTQFARELAENLGIAFEVYDIEPLHLAVESALGDLLASETGAENVQARIRAMVLMSFVNRYGGLLLNTSNKTELTLGYGTIYGDMAGVLCPIADLTKQDVFRLAQWINARQKLIPDFILERLPSAELRPGQVDPFDYSRVSPEMERLVLANRSDGRMRRTEYKRWQMGIILKVSEKAFGSGRMIPVTRK